MWVIGTLAYSWWGYKMIQPLWKPVWQFLKKKKLKIQLLDDPATLSIYPKQLNSGSQRVIGTLMAICPLHHCSQ